MRTESINRNYERNRESRTRKRRFRGATNTESLHEATMKTPPGIRRSRIDMPPRSTKSLSNLSQIDKEPIEDPNNNAGAVTLLPFSRFLKWCKHISMTRETPPPSNSGKSDSFDPNLSPVWHQQSGNIGRKRGFVGPLGLGEYVDSMGGGFDELDLPSAPTHGQGKSRSLIDISMSNLWGAEEQDSKLPESGNCEEEVSEKVHKSSASEDRRPTILATISRLVPLPPTPPNLVHFFDSPSSSANIYDNMETTFFGNSEERWSTPAFVVTSCSQMQRGDLFSVHCVNDYLAELMLTMNWAKSIKYLCDGELRKYRSVSKGKRQRRLSTQQSTSKKSENEAEIKELRADFSDFLEASEGFMTHLEDEFRNSPVRAILIAGHSERLVSMKNILPIQMPFTLNEAQKVPTYRKFLSETPATAVYSPFCRGPESPIEISTFLCSDSLLLASKCCVKKTSTGSGVKSNPRYGNALSLFQGPSGVFETLARFPLTFVGVSVASNAATNTSELLPIIKITPPVLCSSSSGISSAASTEEESEASSENRSTLSAMAITNCQEGTGVDLWWPPGARCHLEFLDAHTCTEWLAYLQATMEPIQSGFANQVLRVKVLNEIAAPEKCVHKYIGLNHGITGHELKEKALKAMNIGCHMEDSEMVATFNDPIRGSLELPLSDEDRPFLMALYITMFSGEKTTEEAIDFFYSDQTDRCFSPGGLNFPLSPDRIPVSFTIKDSSHGASSSSFLTHLLRVSKQETEVFEPPRSILTDRSKSIIYPEGSRAHKTYLRGLSQSSHNLSATSAAASGGSVNAGKGRSRSRLRLHFSRGNVSNSLEDNESDEMSQQFGIFGRLPKEAWPDCRVSMSVMSLFVMVFYKGSLIEGIFRKSVQMSQLQAMIQRVDSNEDPLTADECTPLCAANILKKYFSEIPGHLLIDDKWDEWCKITTLRTDDEIANYAKRMMRELPDINQSLLTFLLFTLAQVRVNQEANKMSVEALSRVWGPNLLERPNAAPSIEDSAMCTSVTACLLGPFTDIYCLGSLEFRQKLSVFFDEIWGQMVQSDASKPLPEGTSILELPETQSEETPSPDSAVESSRSVEGALVREKRKLWLNQSPSEDESPDSANGNRRYLKSLKKDNKFSISQDSADLPPPIPPRNRRKSTSYSPLGPSPPAGTSCAIIDLDIPPPLPARSLSSIQRTSFVTKDQREKISSGTKESGTTVIDRRRSFSRRRHPSRSPVRSCTIDVGVERRRALMIGDICEDYDSLSLASPKVQLKSVKTTTVVPLQRSTSDVDAFLQNKLMESRKKSQTLTEYETNPNNILFPWNTVAARRTSSRNHRCETRWTCGLYTEPNVVSKRVDPAVELASVHLRLSEGSSKPPGVRPRPTAVYLEDRAILSGPPAIQNVSAAVEVPVGICRLISSIYEQKRLTADNGCKNWPIRGSLTSADQLASLTGSTHLSRGSSHTSTGSSTSTTLGPN